MKILTISILALSLTLHAEDAPKPTVEELTAQVTEAKAENERLTKMLNAYAGKYMKCDQELTVQITLGTQSAPAKPQVKPMAKPAEKAKPQVSQ